MFDPLNNTYDKYHLSSSYELSFETEILPVDTLAYKMTYEYIWICIYKKMHDTQAT